MTWEDPRGGGLKVAARGAHLVAHHEQAKSRQDETQGLRTHGSARRWLVGAGAAVAVAVIVVAVTVVARGRSGEPAAATPAAPHSRAAASTSAAPPSAAPAAAVAAVADTEPQGRYALATSTRVTLRDGTHLAPVRQRFQWKFTSGGCSQISCTGTLVSTSGAHYSYVWDGQVLTMQRPPETIDRQVCHFADGSAAPLSQASFSATSTYVVAPTTIAVTDGPPDAFQGRYRYTVKYRYSGDCQASPSETKVGLASFTASRAH